MPSIPKEPVYTPGGMRSREQIHTVGAGEVIARQSDGSFAVSPAQAPNLARTRELLATGQYAFTPGGLRPKSMIHHVRPGEVIQHDGAGFRRFHVQSETFMEAPEAAEAPELPVPGSGWITFASYIEPSANVIKSLTTTWTVPPEPTREDGQLLYLFNGLQDSPVTHILQPVLQWGVSQAGGSSNWSVASWFVDNSGNAFHSSAVAVNPGDVLTGTILLLAQHGTRFVYVCQFAGIANSSIQVNDANQMVNPVQTLEAYTVAECRDYPDTLMVSMRAIAISTATKALPLAYVAADPISDCGQHAIVVSNATGAGQVDLYFTRQFVSQAPATVTSLSRSPDQIDLFAAGTDGSVNSTFWNPAGGWFDRWFRLGDARFGDQFTVPPQSTITALSRFPAHLDLFTVGRDKAVYSTFADDNGGWSGNWFRLGDTNFADGFTVPIRSQVCCLSRSKDIIDLFVAGFDGAVYSTFWTAQQGWSRHWFRLGDDRFWDHFTVTPGTPVSALSRFPEHLDLFVSGRDGGVYSTFWDGATGWTNRWFRLGDSRFADLFTVPPGSAVTAVSRARDIIDLFVSGRDGAVYSTFWTGAGGWHNQWFRLGDNRFGDNFTIPPGSPVTAIARAPDHLDLFASGRDGGVYSTFWDGAHGWSGRWFRLGDARFWDAFTIPPGARVTAQSRRPDVIDLFVTGRDNRIYSTFWTAQHGWLGQWFAL